MGILALALNELGFGNNEREHEEKHRKNNDEVRNSSEHHTSTPYKRHHAAGRLYIEYQMDRTLEEKRQGLRTQIPEHSAEAG